MKATTKVSKTASIESAIESKLLFDASLLPSLFKETLPSTIKETEDNYKKSAEKNTRGFFAYYKDMKIDFFKVVNAKGLSMIAAKTGKQSDIDAANIAASNLAPRQKDLYAMLTIGHSKYSLEVMNRIFVQGKHEILMLAADRIAAKKIADRQKKIAEGKAKKEYTAPELWSYARMIETLKEVSKK